MNKNEQSPTNVLVYILGFLIGTLIMIYGYKSIAYVMNRGEEAMMLKFQQSLKDTIEETARFPGTVRITSSLTAPSKYQKICIMDLYKTDGCDPDYPDFEKDGALICDAYNDQVANVFFLPFQAATIKIPEIKLKEGQSTLCLPINGPVQFKVTGQGRTALVEAVN